MKQGFKIFGYGLILIGALLFAGFLVDLSNLFSYKFFAPKTENIRRETFENTQSYVEGKRQAVISYMRQYNAEKSEDGKKAILYTAGQEFANFDQDKYLFNAEEKAFVHLAKYGN